MGEGGVLCHLPPGGVLGEAPPVILVEPSKGEKVFSKRRFIVGLFIYWADQKNLVKGCPQTLDCYCVSCELLSASIADAL